MRWTSSVTPTDSPADAAALELRPARADEADAIADLYTLVRRVNEPAIPPAVHTAEENRYWAAEMLLPHHEVWVAVDQGRLVGFLALRRPDWIGHLYLHPDYTGHGLGARMIELAKHELAGSIQLWTFQSNAGARRFYARHGFVEVEHTDGDNEERAPDVRLTFTPTRR